MLIPVLTQNKHAGAGATARVSHRGVQNLAGNQKLEAKAIFGVGYFRLHTSPV